MSELFLEIYSEEMPHKSLNSIVDRIKKKIGEIFCSNCLICNIDDDFCKVYITPCRIIFLTKVLSEDNIIKHREIVGPKLDAGEEVIEGFLKAFDLKSVKDLKKVNDNYVLVQNDLKINTKDVLTSIMEDVMNSIFSLFDQNIRWISNGKEVKWISPIRNILCIFNGEVLNFNYCGISSNNYTYGNKTLFGLNEKIEIKNFNDYKTKTEENSVVFDQNEREKIIVDKKLEIENKENLSVLKSDVEFNLIQYAVSSTEYPDVFLGEFESEFLRLPEIVIINILCNKYHCLCLFDNVNKLITNKFILFANTKTNNNGKNIIEGMSNAINSRLSFLNSELIKFLSESLTVKINKLKEIPYHKGFGTLYNKVERLIELSKFICLWIPHSNLLAVEDAAKLCKVDLTTHLIKENPELKGYLASYYAKNNGYSEEICDGIEDYYKPENLEDSIPDDDIGKILSIADKIDNVITLFIANDDLTKSKNTYEIRRDISLIIKLIVDGAVNIPINILIHKSISLFKTNTYKINSESRISVKQRIIDIKNNSLELIKKRFINFVSERGYQKNLILSVINMQTKKAIKRPLNLNVLYKKIVGVGSYIKENNKKFNSILAVHKRLNNILEGFKPHKGSLLLIGIFRKKYYKNEQEKNISKKIKEITNIINVEIKLQNYNVCLDLFAEFASILNEYFKDNLIKSNETNKTYYRLSLLYRVKMLFDNFMNFSELKK